MDDQELEDLGSVGNYKLVKFSEQGKDTVLMKVGDFRNSTLIYRETVLTMAYTIAYFGDEKNKKDSGAPSDIGKWTANYTSLIILAKQFRSAKTSLINYGLFDKYLNPTQEIRKLGEILLPQVEKYSSINRPRSRSRYVTSSVIK